VRKCTFVVALGLVLTLAGCGSGAKLKSAKIVDKMVVDGVGYTFTDQDIVEITLDFSFDKKLTSGLDTGNKDALEKALYDKLIGGAHLYSGSQEVDRTHGFWPDDVGADHANGMVLYYLIPKGAGSDLHFVYDGALLGDKTKGIDKTLSL